MEPLTCDFFFKCQRVKQTKLGFSFILVSMINFFKKCTPLVCIPTECPTSIPGCCSTLIHDAFCNDLALNKSQMSRYSQNHDIKQCKLC